ncbi:hypothetical protein HA72_1709 [Metallosphaera sedula]|uniref:Uncharacterized protein n=4 Tax=Sulfolobaceae TaxID=118883 RepID=A4YHG2_METS5|nr:hypothetical protein Msed_1709 [Metallosphaera sedula DSM 5348]AIM27848.1 hypothetical protein HA72_1709 [Metallosphaera sedula]QCO30722.1 hypothetical protein DFR88_09695 [Metallosphaera prunae]AKV75374.1 hypothetical protein MsedA_1743 [Metallosphaera sedula]AKV77618.1 hypothetical protein MsedB_1745 [Metallosphaera sedula]
MEMDVKCVSCGENGAEILISGKLLCPRCSRQEILHRVRKNLGKAGVNLRGSQVILAYPKFYSEISQFLKYLIEKVCQNCNFMISEVIVENGREINSVIRNLILEIERRPESLVILPFTADFYGAYLVYSSSSLENSYLSLYGLKSEVAHKTLVSPLYDTPITELRGFQELTGELKTGDEVFDTILEWLHSSFGDNEVFHTFPPSILAILGKFSRCRRCGAVIRPDSGEYCKACSTELSLER